MTTTIQRGAVTITPTLTLGYSASTTSRNVEHAIIGRPDADYSLSDDSLRSGTLTLLFADYASAWQAHRLHATAGVFVFADTEQPAVGMNYIRKPVGVNSITLDDQTRRVWVLAIDYQEVAA